MKKGDIIFWTDPDEDTIGRGGSSSGKYTILEVNGEELTLINDAGSEVGAYIHECQLLTDTPPFEPYDKELSGE